MPTSIAGTLNGTKNGVNKSFTMSSLTPISSTLIVWKNTPGIAINDFTVSGNVVTFTAAPLSTDNLHYQGWM